MKRLLCLLTVLCLLLSACSLFDSDSDSRKRSKEENNDDDSSTVQTTGAAPTVPPATTQSTSSFLPPDEGDPGEENGDTGAETPDEREEPEDPNETEEPEEPEESEGENLLDFFSRSDWKRLNTFLSNFSEVGFLSYDAGADTGDMDYYMAVFVFLHYKINDTSKLSYEGEYVKISGSVMDDCCNRFFGKTVAHGTLTDVNDPTQKVDYRGGSFYMLSADGESYNFVTVANHMEQLANGTYYVRYFVYILDLDEYMDHGVDGKYYELTAQEAARNNKLMFFYSGTATIRDYSKNGYQSYQLISYQASLVFN